jgi:hypothetical protein
VSGFVILTTIVEIVFASLLIIGFVNQKKLIKFENNLAKVAILVFKKVRRALRKKAHVNGKVHRYRLHEQISSRAA